MLRWSPDACLQTPLVMLWYPKFIACERKKFLHYTVAQYYFLLNIDYAIIKKKVNVHFLIRETSHSYIIRSVKYTSIAFSFSSQIFSLALILKIFVTNT